MSRGTPEAFSGTGTVGPRRDGLAAVLLRCHIRYSLGELPSMACQILHGAVPLAVLAICGCFEHPCSVRTCALELGIEPREIDLQEAVRFFQGRNRCQSKLLDQPLMECREGPFDPPLGLRRVVIDELYP